MRGFASDNSSGIHPRILAAMIEVNENHAIGYGDDYFSQKAIEVFCNLFGTSTEVFFVFNGREPTFYHLCKPQNHTVRLYVQIRPTLM